MLLEGYQIPPGLAGTTEEDLVGTMYLVSPIFEIDGWDGEYSIVWDWEDTVRVWTEGGYSIHGLVDFEPCCVVLRHEGESVGFYMDGQCWVDPDHRGRGLARAMVVALVAWSRRLPDVKDIGFSEAGYRLHISALRQITQEAERSPSP